MKEDAVANEFPDQDLRALWQAQPEMENRMSTDEIRRKVHGLEAARARRSVNFYAAGAVIICSWLAVMWFLADLRIMAGVCMGTAVWIVYEVQRRSAARLVPAGLTAGPGLEFYRALLERERDFYRGLPVWFLPPVIVSTSAIVLGFLASPRFPHTVVLFGFLVWFVSSTAVALVIGVKKNLREADRCQRDLDGLKE
jgi:hypothetical protein